jgi:hypothetical protein
VHSSCSDVPFAQHQPLGLLPNQVKQLLLGEGALQAEHIPLQTDIALPALVKESPGHWLEVL